VILCSNRISRELRSHGQSDNDHQGGVAEYGIPQSMLKGIDASLEKL
jgi:hypothetical protein